jgi:hypothetical protein
VAPPPSLTLDRTSLWLSLSVGALVLPSLAFLAAYRLAANLDASEWPLGETSAAIACVAAGFLFLFLTLREVFSAARFRLSEGGLAFGQGAGQTIPWASIRGVDAKEFGVLRVAHPRGKTRVVLYFFEQRDKISRYIQDQVRLHGDL